MRRPLELSIENENEEDDEGCRMVPYFRIVRFGDHVIDVLIPTYYEAKLTIKRWFQERNREKRRSPLVAGLSFFRDFPDRKQWWLPRSGNRNHPSNPIYGIALCLGGSHCLFIENVDYYEHLTNSRVLRDFLANSRVTIVGVGIKKAAASLEKDCGIHLGKPVEAKMLMEEAYGKDEMMGRSGLEEMAQIALDGMRVARTPVDITKNKWAEDSDIDEERVMQTTFDAFLCFEVGVKCLQKLGQPT
ncbi:hypothetical protein J5N97_019283 [Dioscorea zingiberensis]|uniref:3'-5' exonuclease domain-containing protein n=1 Tax=Dioscorea zingiberensis TaxID=325984 RepID=A0A9D5CEB1_9LILI|nr:hypothetical protein J5N97_019283 [Dioscorea zingiberensis]